MDLHAAAHKSHEQDRTEPGCPETQLQDHHEVSAPGVLILARTLL